MGSEIIYVDVDDTLIRSAGTKRIAIPATVESVRQFYAEGRELYCWSSGGAEYAREAATELGIDECFRAFLPKPNLIVDDQSVESWRYCEHVHPNELGRVTASTDPEQWPTPTSATSEEPPAKAQL